MPWCCSSTGWLYTPSQPSFSTHPHHPPSSRSLDQLRDENQARSKISFLRGVKPHPDTRIIVSALPDDKITGDQRNNADGVYYYGCDTCLAMHCVPRVEVLDYRGAMGQGHGCSRCRAHGPVFESSHVCHHQLAQLRWYQQRTARRRRTHY